MYIFIDESGIHKSVDCSTFVLVYIESEDIETMNKTIERIERKLNIDAFHWSKSVWKIKKEFLSAVLTLDFTIKVAIVTNPVHPAQELERLLTHMLVERNITRVIIDGKKPKWYERRIKKILRDKGIAVRKLSTVRSHQYTGIRVADCIAGLCRWYADGKRNDEIDLFYERLKRKITVTLQ